MRTPEQIVKELHSCFPGREVDLIATIQKEAFECGRVESSSELQKSRSLLWGAANMLSQAEDHESPSWFIVRDDLVPEIRAWVLERATSDTPEDKWIRSNESYPLKGNPHHDCCATDQCKVTSKTKP